MLFDISCQLNSMLLINFCRVNTDCLHKFESPGPILFLLDCTIPIKPTRNVRFRVFPSSQFKENRVCKPLVVSEMAITLGLKLCLSTF